MNQIEIRATFAPWHGGVDILVRERRTDGMQAVATNLIFETKPEGSLIEPTLRINNTQAQTLIDDLWNAGLRPTEGSGSAGSLAATERHLKDMQIIAKGLLKKDGVDV